MLALAGDIRAEIALYEAAGWHHELLLEKYCALLGATLAGVVAYEDRVAVSYLRFRPDCSRGAGVGCIGPSGGGCRAALLQATCDRAAARAPSPLLVQYNRGDQLFPPEGMRAAHERLTSAYRDAGRPEAYTGHLHDGSHKFDLAMQQAAFSWLHAHLDPRGRATPPTGIERTGGGVAVAGGRFRHPHG